MTNNLFCFVASPIHSKQHVVDQNLRDIDVPADIMVSLMPALERLVNENRLSIDAANQMVVTRKVPFEIAQTLGLVAHSGSNSMEMFTTHSQSVLPLSINYNQYFGFNTGRYNTSNLGNFNEIASPSNINTGFSSFPMNPSANNSACPSPIYPSFSGSSSPNPYYGTSGGGASPMHQITKGISGLTTGGGGSITRGTSAAFESAVANQPLDLTMDVMISNDATNMSSSSTNATGWYVPAQFYDLKPLNLSPAQQVRVVPTPPASPNLCIIQEENPFPSIPSVSYCTASPTASGDDANFPHSHPQICLTDVLGSEITLVALSDASRDSDDSLEEQNSITLQELIISEPSSDMPSITRGVGRKSSLEIEHRQQQQETYERRGSDRSEKSLAFSDDSLSNDSNNLSPGHEHEPSASSGFKSGDSHSDTCDHTESRLSPDSLSDSRMSDECYELPLPHECSNLDSQRILEFVKQAIDSKMPPKGFVLQKPDPDGDLPLSVDISNLSLEYSGGLQIELQVCDGRSGKSNNTGKGIKLRRISGDQFEYGKLCQQLISSLTV